jgi:4-hydroxybenzoate polyprenyltransferase
MQTSSSDRPGRVADAHRRNWVDSYAPDWLKPYARLARWDRPIPLLLLFWPCAFALAMAPGPWLNWWYLALMLVGSALMRGAGCTFNDIVDRDIDMKVARTRSRPIPSGAVSRRQALAFMVAQALLGLVILLQFNTFAIQLGIASLVLVAIYPFMKRVTWWPQLFLGLAFSYGALLGWAAVTGSLSWPPVLLYAGCICWTIGYDTIYALQDIEDDALIGVKSTARLFGDRVRPVTALFYAGTLVLWLAAGLLAGMSTVFAMALIVPAAILFWQIATLDRSSPENARARFYANHWVGLTLTLALLAGKLLL